MIEKINLTDKLSRISEHWRPKTVATLNGQEVKVAKFQGTFVWHHHEDAEEMFLGVRGHFKVEFLDHEVEIGPGDIVVIPRGVEHRTVAEEEAEVLIFEAENTRNTGNIVDETFTAELERI
ncbi:MAG: cupin domain-containing protein [Thermoanaerobaculia bacterium]